MAKKFRLMLACWNGSAVERDLTRLRDGPHKVDHHGEMLALLGCGEVPLEGTAEHADKVELKVRLALGREGVLASVGSLGLVVGLILLEILIDTGEPDKLKQSRACRTGMVLLVGLDGGVVLGTLAQQDVIHAVSVLDAENERHTRVVDQVLANMTRIDNGVNAVLLQLPSGTYTTQHEELGGFEDSLGEDNLAAGEEAQLIARSINDRHTLTGTVRVVDDEALGVHLGDNGDVGLVLHKYETARTYTLVDTVTAVGDRSSHHHRCSR